MTSLALTGAGLGALAGTGAATAVVRLPLLRRPRLDDRLAPYLRDSGRSSRLLDAAPTLTPFPTIERIVGPTLRDGVHLLERVLGGGASIRVRLEQAGRGTSLEEFRAQQVLWGAGALLGAILLSIVLLARGTVHQPFALLIACLLATATGVVLRDQSLSAEVRRRELRMISEFPTIAELLALAVAAGEGATGALERVTRISRGELSRELGRALADARAGASLIAALQGIATRTSLPALARFVDGIAIAVERGTPLADVLRAQAVDVREAGKRALLDVGGKKEIAMMTPVVFLVLPVTVVFALFPGFIGISLQS